MTYYSSITQDSVENASSLDLVSEVLEEIAGSLIAVHSICEAANNAFSGLFMAVLTSDPNWNLGLCKHNFYSSVRNAMLTYILHTHT